MEMVARTHRGLRFRLHGDELAVVVQSANTAWRLGDVRGAFVESDSRKRLSQLFGSRAVSG